MVDQDWKEVHLPADSRASLGRIAWMHIHTDGSEHEAKFSPPPGIWGGLVSTIPAGSKIECLDCDAVVE